MTIALSGGLDSMVLLHLFSRLTQKNVVAHHIHHGLSPNADHWLNFCQQQSEALQVKFRFNRVVLNDKSRSSLEALARDARYSALQENFTENSYLVTAHHQDDQLETILLALKRGAGLTGLQGIVGKQNLNKGYLIRPLLDFSREQLEQYASLHQLDWIEDESNLDQRFDRNFIRHSITPLLKARWPSIGKTVSRSALHCQTQQAIVDELIEQDFTQCALATLVLSITALQSLSKARRDNVLRLWFKKSGLTYPSTKQLSSIWQDIALAQADATPKLKLQSRILYRYREKLYLIEDKKLLADNKIIVWKGEQILPLCAGKMRLKIETSASFVIEKHHVEVCFRSQLSDAIKCQPIGRNKTRSVKKLLHEYEVPPWR
ncbi:tRNA lysidine(34) synthetase TilS [Psychromonas sp. KJ10-10]|uniref:tRNA lysidine(34) synthetase TilS n=1 Tax=Psychromonas sp. KJ10-10 TaxID=3391823 RepID=UPI0039B3A5A3